MLGLNLSGDDDTAIHKLQAHKSDHLGYRLQWNCGEKDAGQSRL